MSVPIAVTATGPDALALVASRTRSASMPAPAESSENAAGEGDAAAPRQGTRLVLHGEVSFGAIPHLEIVLESVVALGPLQLTIDLSDASAVSPDALAAIVRHQGEVEKLIVELPPAVCTAILDLTAVCAREGYAAGPPDEG